MLFWKKKKKRESHEKKKCAQLSSKMTVRSLCSSILSLLSFWNVYSSSVPSPSPDGELVTVRRSAVIARPCPCWSNSGRPHCVPCQAPQSPRSQTRCSPRQPPRPLFGETYRFIIVKPPHEYNTDRNRSRSMIHKKAARATHWNLVFFLSFFPKSLTAESDLTIRTYWHVASTKWLSRSLVKGGLHLTGFYTLDI